MAESCESAGSEGGATRPHKLTVYQPSLQCQVMSWWPGPPSVLEPEVLAVLAVLQAAVSREPRVMQENHGYHHDGVCARSITA